MYLFNQFDLPVEAQTRREKVVLFCVGSAIAAITLFLRIAPFLVIAIFGYFVSKMASL